MSILNSVLNNPISTSAFFYDPTIHTFMADASELPRFQQSRIYDACDEGFALKSATTGQVVVYSLIEEIKQDGETMGWRYAPIPEHVRKMKCPARLVIYND